MQKLLWIISSYLFRGHTRAPDEAVVDVPSMNRKIVKDVEKLEEQEARGKLQQKELAETQARIRFLRAQLNTLGGGSHKGELD